ncbi:MAG: B12-binding domain-containing radical SAM protein [Bacteroidales bacterium]|nr:B12-binding domain-containing radical SAM protein [Bacteroidales bacterium]MCF8386779.1 B12-binding domain-containing radical SAM protein [Bacteroidales bacterium]MCF8398226.1 B12-binding domain-containing radical SAM protein [Bacteroidales bacterium]
MGNKKYKLLLINPLNRRKTTVQREVISIYPPISLGIIAALTPSHWEVEILDEIFEEFEVRDADLVGITSLTPTVNRAYEIAANFREKNIPVVLGGIHASMMPEEAMQFVDTVVKGEAENIWQQLINDFENNKLKNIYEAQRADIHKIPLPRYDLYNKAYEIGSIQTTRGCPMNCDFCSVHVFNGRKYRTRPVDEVVKEFINMPQERIAFVDDNLCGYSKRTEDRLAEICKKIIDSGVRKKWFCSASMNIGENPELLQIMAKAGCQMIFLGIESEVVDSLMAMNKSVNYKIGVDNFSRIYENIHQAGIAVLGAFILGLESDTATSIRKRVDYILNSAVDAMQVTILTPLPGTVLYERLEKSGKLLYTNYPADWERYNVTELVYQPDHIGIEEFQHVTSEGWNTLYNSKALSKRIIKTAKATRNPDAAKWAYSANVQYHNVFLEESHVRQDVKDLFIT